LMTRTALHACCAIVVPSATMRVQNYAVAKYNVAVLLRLTRDLFPLFVQQQANISTDTERRADVSAVAEPLDCVLFRYFLICCEIKN